MFGCGLAQRHLLMETAGRFLPAASRSTASSTRKEGIETSTVRMTPDTWRLKRSQAVKTRGYTPPAIAIAVKEIAKNIGITTAEALCVASE
ncbi:hypothetical protein BC937DRAFT_92038 [Endogone sp. FLAS-F59071]|nr:hypothetical protein BC937DRAFT_92038 [Endogone sp. FLAS-F59071]|eukprot:RUS21627.1 hypothetical protein BC937DRAFT_92038 [Endogone sp. FLAS-F59071]